MEILHQRQSVCILLMTVLDGIVPDVCRAVPEIFDKKQAHDNRMNYLYGTHILFLRLCKTSF